MLLLRTDAATVIEPAAPLRVPRSTAGAETCFRLSTVLSDACETRIAREGRRHGATDPAESVPVGWPLMLGGEPVEKLRKGRWVLEHRKMAARDLDGLDA